MSAYATTTTLYYELLDSGEGMRLERFGDVILARPDPQVLWGKMQPALWDSVHAEFAHKGLVGQWKKKQALPHEWVFTTDTVSLVLRLGTNKHIGVFPEQFSQWEKLKQLVTKRMKTGAQVNVLNLFAYTGGVSCVLADAGAKVTHVDASKQSIMWAHVNKKTNNLKETSITFMLDDVVKFVEREIRRGNTYDLILLDPPVYGKGTKKEAWRLEEGLVPLLVKVSKLLSKKPLCVHVSGYASVYSHQTYKNILGDIFPSAQLESGELYIKESHTERMLTAGMYSSALFI